MTHPVAVKKRAPSVWTSASKQRLSELATTMPWEEVVTKLNIPGMTVDRARRYYYSICRGYKGHKIQASTRTERTCNMCLRPFLSWGAGNRRCPICSSTVRSQSIDDVTYSYSAGR